MGTSRENTNTAVLERVAGQAASTEEWWTALSFDENVVLGDDPVLTNRSNEEIELRLYSL
ncbi:MAG: hypothetical protein ABR598_07480 [Candidatus Dormibacteria bacterium]